MTVSYDNMSTTSRSEQLFTKCCCCFPLRVGCLILGYLNLLINVYYTVSLMFIITVIGIYTNGFDDVDPTSDPTYSDPSTEEVKDASIIIGVKLMIIIVVNALWLILNIACLVGLHKRRPGPVRVYVGFASVRLVLGMLIWVHTVVADKVQVETTIVCGIDLALAAYFLLVYYVYAKQLERENNEIILEETPQITDIAFIYPTKLAQTQLIA